MADSSDDKPGQWNPDTTDPTKLKQQSEALLFVSDLKTNSSLGSKWKSYMELLQNDSKLTMEQKLKGVNNFLAHYNYWTTGALVFSFMNYKVDGKENFYQQWLDERKPNAASNDFVQRLLANSTLLGQWQAAIQKDQTDRGAADAFLKTEKVDCTAAQVNASFVAMRAVDIKFWTGIYGNVVATTKDSDGKSTSKTGPTILVTNSIDHVTIGTDELDVSINQMTYSKSVLTWKHSAVNFIQTDGKITFSQITRPYGKDKYVGNEFFGTITYYDDSMNKTHTASVLGRVGKPPKTGGSGGSSGHSGHTLTPAAAKLSPINQAMKYLGYLMAAVFVVDFLASIPKRFKSVKEFFEKTKPEETGQKSQDQAAESLEENNKVAEENPPDKSYDEEAGASFDDDAAGSQDLEAIPDDELPPAEDVQELEQQSEQINEEGEFEGENGSELPENENAPEVDPEEAGSFEESGFGELGSLFE